MGLGLGKLVICRFENFLLKHLKIFHNYMEKGCDGIPFKWCHV